MCVASVALIVPVRDEEASIAPFLECVYRNTEVLTEQGIAFEFIFVNDGSTDTTLDCLLLAQKDDPRVRIVDLSRSFGPEAALTAGLDLCDADAAIPIDVDLQGSAACHRRPDRQMARGFRGRSDETHRRARPAAARPRLRNASTTGSRHARFPRMSATSG